MKLYHEDQEFKKKRLFCWVQWLRILPSNEENMGLIPGRGTKIPHASEELSN